MRAYLAGIAAAVAAFALCPAAAADNVGAKGDAAFGADRLSGLYFVEVSTEAGNGRDVEIDLTEFGLGWGIPGVTPYTIPRLAFDFFVIERLSVGGAIAYASVDDDDDRDDDDPSRFLFAPRVGYALPLGQVFTFWPRGGISIHDYDGPDEGGVALTAEAMFVASPAPHFGFAFGPVLDLSITGERGDRDHRYRVFGVTAGLVAWL